MAGLLAIYNCYKAAGFAVSKTLAIVFRVHPLPYYSTIIGHNELSLNTNLVAVGRIRTYDLMVMSHAS